MGLYLCVFDNDDEIDGVDVGGYADFTALRRYILSEVEGGKRGSRFPTFMLHSDCDGEWSVTDCETLRQELAEIASSLRALAAKDFGSEWQRGVAKSIGLKRKMRLSHLLTSMASFCLSAFRG